MFAAGAKAWKRKGTSYVINCSNPVEDKISSDIGMVVSGSNDLSVLVWDKQTTQLLEELKGHDAQIWELC